jgi:hypothetical protein
MILDWWGTNFRLRIGFAQLSEHERPGEVFSPFTNLIRKGFEVSVPATDENVGASPSSCADNELLRMPRSALGS